MAALNLHLEKTYVAVVCHCLLKIQYENLYISTLKLYIRVYLYLYTYIYIYIFYTAALQFDLYGN